MPTPLTVLASILEVFALVLIPLMMYSGGRQNRDHNVHGNNQGKKHNAKELAV
jgi:hypothetical protein